MILTFSPNRMFSNSIWTVSLNSTEEMKFGLSFSMILTPENHSIIRIGLESLPPSFTEFSLWQDSIVLMNRNSVKNLNNTKNQLSKFSGPILILSLSSITENLMSIKFLMLQSRRWRVLFGVSIRKSVSKSSYLHLTQTEE